jgi:hypothetical protein
MRSGSRNGWRRHEPAAYVGGDEIPLAPIRRIGIHYATAGPRPGAAVGGSNTAFEKGYSS